jgi:tetratricopeptide (TPR) repeat protein
MRRSTLSLVFLFLSTVPGARAEEPWTDLAPKAAIARAKAEKRPVLIDFYAVWCGPCKEMDKSVYPDPAVRALMKGFLNVKVDAEKGEGLELAKTYKIFNYPTVVLLGADGAEIDRILGSMSAEEFVKTARGYLEGKGTLQDKLARLRENPDDLELRLEIGDKYSQYQDVESANRYLGRVVRRALKADPVSPLAQQALLALADVYRRNDRHAEAAEVLEDFRLLFPGGKLEGRAVNQLARAYAKDGRREQAIELYTGWLESKGLDDKDALNAYAWFFAKQGFNLDRAIAHAGRAAELSKREPGILDTLAEAYHAAGRHDEAIAVMKECLAREPDDVYFQSQLQKFEEARAKAAELPVEKAAKP